MEAKIDTTSKMKDKLKYEVNLQNKGHFKNKDNLKKYIYKNEDDLVF